MRDQKKIWKQTLSLIKPKTTEVSYRTWFQTADVVAIDDTAQIVYLKAASQFYANILKNRYLNMLEESFESVLGSHFRVVVNTAENYDQAPMANEKTQTATGPEPSSIIPDRTGQESLSETSRSGIENMKTGMSQQRIFNPKYTFDQFVIGNSNKYAQAAARAVAESPAQAYNPLFIYGGSGLGKTHLMHAIGLYLLKHRPDLNVLYVSSEMFTNELIKALGDNKTRAFKDKYRKVDVLLIDDIQFLEGKDTTQEEFFYTFNTLYDLNKQIVISSDRPPNELVKLEERLRSRFAWNMIASLSPPDYETRVAILKKKAENENIEIDDNLYDVICLIAENIKDNIRELEGAFSRIIGFSQLMNEEINRNFAKRMLRDILQNGSENVTPEKIKTIVSRYYKITVNDLESKTRKQSVAHPRQIAMYLCRSMTDYSFDKIGNLFGGRHYSTVMHACEKIQEDEKNDENLKASIQQLKHEIEK